MFRQGKILRIKPTTKCNLNCSYCTVNKAHGKAPKFEEKPYFYWQDEIYYNHKPRILVISGGEPGLYEGIYSLINMVVPKRIPIQIITNLTVIDKFMMIQKSWRVIFLATYHPSADRDLFMNNYRELSKKFHITVREIQYIPGSSTKLIMDEQSDAPMEIYAPDGTLHNSCKALDEAGS